MRMAPATIVGSIPVGLDARIDVRTILSCGLVDLVDGSWCLPYGEAWLLLLSQPSLCSDRRRDDPFLDEGRRSGLLV
jgi:hypothetical protein